MPTLCTIQKRKRGAWGPDDYFLKCKEGIIGFFPTRQAASAKLSEIRQRNKQDSKKKK
jgi:hypothetical protein